MPVSQTERKKSKVFFIRLREETYRRLKIYSAKTDIPMLEIASRAIERYLDELESKEEVVKR